MSGALRRAAGVVALALALAAPAVRARPPVWVIKSDHARIVLFGSLHVLPKGLDWLPPEVSESLAKADDVWFELPMDAANQARVGELARDRGTFPTGESLSGALGAARWARLTRDAATVGVPPAALDRLRPWLADVVLSLALDGLDGASGADGVEARIAALAPSDAQRRAFETPDQQIELLAGAPALDQIAGLTSTFGDIEDKKHAYRRLLTAWIDGDLVRLRREVLDPLRTKTPVLYDRLIRDRNRRWVAALQERLKGRGTAVVIVGLGHLVGPEGVPAQLRARGLRVEGP